MFRYILYPIIGGLVGFFVGLGVVILAVPVPQNDVPVQNPIALPLLFAVLIMCAIAGFFVARFVNKRDTSGGGIDYSKIPPPVLATILISAWMDGVAFFGGIAVAVLFNIDPSDTVTILIMSLILPVIGALIGVWHVRYMHLDLSGMGVDTMSLWVCVFSVTGIVAGNWREVMESPLAIIGTFITLIPAYIAIRHTIKREYKRVIARDIAS